MRVWLLVRGNFLFHFVYFLFMNFRLINGFGTSIHFYFTSVQNSHAAIITFSQGIRECFVVLRVRVRKSIGIKTGFTWRAVILLNGMYSWHKYCGLFLKALPFHLFILRLRYKRRDRAINLAWALNLWSFVSFVAGFCNCLYKHFVVAFLR